MATKRVFHPPLISLFPVLAVFSANVGLFPLHELLRPALISLIGGIALWLVFAGLCRSWTNGAWVASLSVVGFWTYEPLFSRFALGSWLGWAFVAVFCIIGLVTRKKSESLVSLCNRFAVILVLVAGSTVALKAVRPSLRFVSGASATAGAPDVLYLQLDGYGRADQLKRVMGFDNGPFLKELETRGFFVATRARSNYVQTAVSLASTLNLATIQSLFPEGAAREDLTLLVDRPRVVKEFRARGYESIGVTTGFPAFTLEGFDLVIKNEDASSYFEAILLDRTPIHVPPSLGRSRFEERQDSLLRAFDELGKLGIKTSKPRFVFAHILAPHPPFVFGANGERLPIDGPFGFWDGSEYMQHAGTPDKYRSGYVHQIQWLNKELLELIDKLDKRTLIILQSDHGSKLGLDQNQVQTTDLPEAFGILAAYRVPPEVRARLTESTTPLNAFQAVVSYALDIKLVDGSDRSYYSPFDGPTDFVDVTDKLGP